MKRPKDTLEIECLVKSLQDVMKANDEHEKAADNYDGPSWGYYGAHYVRDIEKAARDFQERLDTYIDQAVQRKLDALANTDGRESKPAKPNVSPNE